MPRKLSALLVLTAACQGQPVITTIAGSDFVFPRTPLPALNAPLQGAFGVLADGSGNLIFSDGFSRVYRVTPSGALTVIAGNGFQGFSGDGGPATAAALNDPRGLALDTAGNLYIADFGNYRVRRLSPDGVISTVAGNGNFGYSGDNGPGVGAALKPSGVALDRAGNLYIADPNNNRVRKLAPNGIITTAAGSGDSAFAGDNGPAAGASLFTPYAVAVDLQGNLYVGDSGNSRVRKVSPAGVISTVAGSGSFIITGDNIPATSAGLGFVTAVTVDAGGNIFIAGDDPSGAGSLIRKVSPAGIISRIGGSGEAFAGDGGPALAASFNDPQGLALDSAQNLYIGDYLNRRVRKISASGIVSTIAGSPLYGFSGDAGPATAASLTKPDAVAVDASGNVYIADTGNNRVRKISPGGVISTVAGNGQYGYSGDGGPALAASLNSPEGVAVDSAGNLYIADERNARVRKVTPQGFISTIAGNGQCCYLGDGGQATDARLTQPYGIAVDLAGNLYIADSGNGTVRRVSPNGIIATVAGGGTISPGDGGQATAARLSSPYAVAVDGAGNLYIADAFDHRLRKVDPSGVISTIAGNGQYGSSGDGGPASAALLGVPVGVALDGAGNIYIVDAGTNSVRRIAPDGIIVTLAGNGFNAFAGDGGPAASAALNHPDGVAADAAGNVYIADTLNNRVRMVLAAPPALSYRPQSFSFSGTAGGAPTPAQELLVSTSVPFVAFQISVATNDGANWLAADLTSGTTPRSIQITGDPSVLSAAGTYSGQITITSPLAAGSPVTIPVSFVVGAALPPALALDQNNLTFTYPAGARAYSQAVRVRNAGGGSLDFTVAIDPGAPWLSVAPASGSVTPAAPVSLAVTADPAGLAAGTYTGSFTVSAESSITVPVLMNISARGSAFLLSQAGMSFTAIEQGGTVPPQNIAISNLGTSPLNPRVDATTLGGGNWLLPALTGDASSVDIRVDASQLKQGRYYGLVRVQSPGAANTPQVATAMLDVLAAGANLGAALQPNELTFNTSAGTGAPGSQTVLIYNLTATPKTFVASASDAFLAIAPRNDAVPPDQPSRLIVQPFTASLSPGTYRGSITLQFDDGAVRVLRVTVIVAAAASGKAGRGSVAGSGPCQPTQLIPSIRSLGSGFAAPAGWPVAIQAQVQDDCGTPLETGSVTAEFSNGDAPLSLRPIPGGRWDVTWQSHSNTAAVTVTLRADSNDKQLSGSQQVSGAFGAKQSQPVVAAVANSASGVTFQPLTPGGQVTLSGSLLSDQTAQAPAVPFGTTLANTAVVIAGQAMPIALTDPASVTALIPYGIEVNTQQQIYVLRDDTYSVPVSVNLSAAAPAIFTTGGTRGMIVDANGKLVDGGNPAKAGGTVTLYCTGLGELNEAVSAGDYGPASSSTRIPVAVTIGGQNAPVIYSGLAPQLVGIYFVQVTVPDGLPAGDVPVTLISSGNPPSLSPPVLTTIGQP